MNSVYSIDNTIFAWATLRQRGGRAILRLSGPETFAVMQKLFTPDVPNDPANRPARKATSGYLHLADDLKVRCWSWQFPGPHSYTGQDMVELHTISSPPLMRLIDQQMIAVGLEPAKPGEFTARAFLLGKMDLTQAQAVRELIDAQNDAQVEAALTMLEGKLHQWLSESYAKLAELVTLLEADIDFSEEEIEFISLEQLILRLDQLSSTIEGILNQAIDSKTITSLPQVFLVGSANAGKSTLMNKLTGLDRAICSPLPGTTRDILTAVWPFDQREVLLCDTAGLLEHPADTITRQAIDQTSDFLQLADLTLFVVDSVAPIQNQLRLFESLGVKQERIIVAINKTDVADVNSEAIIAAVERRFDKNRIYSVSGRTGQGLSDLTAAVFDKLANVSVIAADGQIALDLRGRQALEETLASLKQAQLDARTLEQSPGLLGLEIVAVDLQQGLRSLGTLLGKDVTENVLENIFSRFCIGK
jgi:tRNA modification GTPase